MSLRTWMDGFARGFRRDPWLAVLIGVTIALGVGVSTVLYGYFSTWLHPRVAAPDAERVAAVRLKYPESVVWYLSSVELDAVRDSRAFEQVSSSVAVNATVGAPGGNLFAWGQVVDGSFFDFFAGRASVGRLLGAADDTPGAPSVVVLSHRLWRTAFAADPSIVGRRVKLNSEECTVVGVAERQFEGVGFASEFFVPTRLGDVLTGLARSQNPTDRWLVVRGRLPDSPGALERADASIAAAFAALNQTQPLPEGESRVPLLVLESSFDPEFAQDPFFLAARLLAASGALFVLLGAANLAGLLLARAAAHDREWAVRKALGAAPARLAGAIVGRLLPPALVGLAGAALVATVVEDWIERTMGTPMAGLGPGWASETSQIMEIGWRGVVFALAATVATILLAALPPFLRVVRRDPNRTLRAESPGGGGDHAVLAPRKVLVALQLALAVTLLVGSGLLVRSLGAAANGVLGFDPRGLALTTLNLPRSSGAGGGAATDLATLLGVLERARAIGGVESATLTLVPPFAPNRREISVAKAETPDALTGFPYSIVGPRYLETLGVPIVSGRALDERDAPDAPPAIVVTAALAQKLWGHEPAVGRRIRLGQPVRPGEAGPEFEVVGVAADAAFGEPTVPRPPMIFFAFGQRRHARMTLLVRAAAPLATIEPALRDLVSSTRADASLVDLVPADEQLRRTLHPMRLNATVAAGLGIGGLVTALVGLFALQLYTVQLRRRDFAVRIALGARSGDLSRLVLGEASRLALAGLAVGLAAAAAVVRLLGSLLYGVTAFDPWTFAAVPIALALTVALAGWIPARRAARADPIRDLRAG